MTKTFEFPNNVLETLFHFSGVVHKQRRQLGGGGQKLVKIADR